METCPYSPQISAYHDGELAGEARRHLEEHLSSACPPCMAELQQWRHLSALMSSSSVPSLPDAARRKLLQLAPAVRDAGFVRLAEWATALAASVLIAVSTWMMVNRQTAAPPQPVADASSWQVAALTSSDSAADAQAEPQFADVVATSFAASGNGNHE